MSESNRCAEGPAPVETHHTMRLSSVLLSVLCVCGFLLAAYAWNEIYGIGGWRDELDAAVGEVAVAEARQDLRVGLFRVYDFTGESSRSNRKTDRSREGFEVWIPRFAPELGRAHLYRTKAFVEEYNRIVRRKIPADLQK